MINPDLDSKFLASSFKTDSRLMIENFLLPDVAERIHDACLDSIPFDIVYVRDGIYKSKSGQILAAMSPQEKQELNNGILSDASKGVGFLP